MDLKEDTINQTKEIEVFPSSLSNNIDADDSSSPREIEDNSTESIRENTVATERNEEGGLNRTENLSDISDGVNDSEAETIHLEESSNKYQPQDEIPLPSRKEIPHSKINYLQRNGFDGKFVQTDVEEKALMDDKVHFDELLDSTKSFTSSGVYTHTPSAPDNLEILKIDSELVISKLDSDTRKRKRSVLDDTILDEVIEPLHKRTGSILADSDGFLNGDEIVLEEISSNFVTENISLEEEGVPLEEESAEELEHVVTSVNLTSESPHTNSYPSRMDQKEKCTNESDILNHEDDPKNTVDQDSAVIDINQKISEIDMPVNEEEDENEAATRNEEAIEQKRTAFDRLDDIERQFSIFRERLYEERLKQLNDEDNMLRQPQPSHPKYLAWLQCIDSRRDERIRIADKQYTYKLECLKKVAVAQRSQILAQYQQEIRSIREKKLEQLGEQWYKIQNDRRSSTGVCPEFSLRFPRKRTQQLTNHIAYCNEVSILSGVAKYVGFPAAPGMTSVSATELEEDLEKIGRSKRNSQAPPPIPLHELVALRTASSNPKYKPTEEQYSEQTSWANSQHQLNLHLTQRQISSSQVPRTVSPIAKVQNSLHRLSPQQGSQNCGHSPNLAVCHQNTKINWKPSTKDAIDILDTTLRASKLRPGSRQTSLSPPSSQILNNLSDSTQYSSKAKVMHNIKSSTISPVAVVDIDYLRESRLSA